MCVWLEYIPTSQWTYSSFQQLELGAFFLFTYNCIATLNFKVPQPQFLKSLVAPVDIITFHQNRMP